MNIEITQVPGGVAAQLHDHLGPIGPKLYGKNNEDVAFALGVLYGSCQQQFARPIDELVEAN